MYLYIEVVDVVANAFMQLLKDDGKRYILFSQLDDYGAKVIEVLNKSKGIHAVYVVSQDSQHNLCANYSDFFEEYKGENGERGISLKNGITSMDIWAHFCAALSIQVMSAFKEVSVL